MIPKNHMVRGVTGVIPIFLLVVIDKLIPDKLRRVLDTWLLIIAQVIPETITNINQQIGNLTAVAHITNWAGMMEKKALVPKLTEKHVQIPVGNILLWTQKKYIKHSTDLELLSQRIIIISGVIGQATATHISRRLQPKKFAREPSIATATGLRYRPIISSAGEIGAIGQHSR